MSNFQLFLSLQWADTAHFDQGKHQEAFIFSMCLSAKSQQYVKRWNRICKLFKFHTDMQQQCSKVSYTINS